jgi:dissimilatory sulfite reductase related protein
MMATKTICGKTVQVNDEGFMTNPAEWDAGYRRRDRERRRHRSAHRRPLEGDRLLPRQGASPAKRPPCARSRPAPGVSTKELFGLFPKGPAKKVAKISGLGKPEGCV